MVQEPGHLREMVKVILRWYLSPTPPGQDNRQGDQVRQHIVLLLQDFLYVWELDVAISDGDWGRVEDYCALWQNSSVALAQGTTVWKYCTLSTS